MCDIPAKIEHNGWINLQELFANLHQQAGEIQTHEKKHVCLNIEGASLHVHVVRNTARRPHRRGRSQRLIFVELPVNKEIAERGGSESIQGSSFEQLIQISHGG